MYRIVRGRFKSTTFTRDDVLKEIDEHNMLVRLNNKHVVQISDSDVEVVEDESVEATEEGQEGSAGDPGSEAGQSQVPS